MSDPSASPLDPSLVALRAAYAQQIAVVRAVARLLGIPPSVLDEVALQAFVMAHGRGEDLSSPDRARARMAALTRRVAEWFREELPPGAGDAPLAVTGGSVLTHFLAGLSEPARDIFVLGELGGLKVPEISAELGLGFDTVRAAMVEVVRDFAAATTAGGAEEVLHDLVEAMRPAPHEIERQCNALTARLSPQAEAPPPPPPPPAAEPPRAQWVVPSILRGTGLVDESPPAPAPTPSSSPTLFTGGPGGRVPPKGPRRPATALGTGPSGQDPEASQPESPPPVAGSWGPVPGAMAPGTGPSGQVQAAPVGPPPVAPPGSWGQPMPAPMSTPTPIPPPPPGPWGTPAVGPAVQAPNFPPTPAAPGFQPTPGGFQPAPMPGFQPAPPAPGGFQPAPMPGFQQAPPQPGSGGFPPAPMPAAPGFQQPAPPPGPWGQAGAPAAMPMAPGTGPMGQVPQTGPRSIVADLDVPERDLDERPPRLVRRPMALFVVALLVLGVAGGGGFLAWQHFQPEPEPEPEPIVEVAPTPEPEPPPPPEEPPPMGPELPPTPTPTPTTSKKGGEKSPGEAPVKKGGDGGSKAGGGSGGGGGGGGTRPSGGGGTAPIPEPTPKKGGTGDRPGEADPGRVLVELEYLSAIDKALKAGNWAQALAYVEQHDRELPGGQLIDKFDERRIRALCGMGRGAEAKSKVDQILAKRPGSKVKAALSESCK